MLDVLLCVTEFMEQHQFGGIGHDLIRAVDGTVVILAVTRNLPAAHLEFLFWILYDNRRDFPDGEARGSEGSVHLDASNTNGDLWFVLDELNDFRGGCARLTQRGERRIEEALALTLFVSALEGRLVQQLQHFSCPPTRVCIRQESAEILFGLQSRIVAEKTILNFSRWIAWQDIARYMYLAVRVWQIQFALDTNNPVPCEHQNLTHQVANCNCLAYAIGLINSP